MKKKERLTAYQYLLKDKLSGDKNRELIALLKDIKLAGRQVAKELNSATLNNTIGEMYGKKNTHGEDCLLYTSPSPRDLSTSRMPSSA